jgi:hypothetical protein
MSSSTIKIGRLSITRLHSVKNSPKQKISLEIRRSSEQFLCRPLCIKKYMIFNSCWESREIFGPNPSKTAGAVTFLTGKEGRKNASKPRFGDGSPLSGPKGKTAIRDGGAADFAFLFFR